MTEMPVRKTLYHTIPSWVDTGDYWFVTICCKERGRNLLANEKVFNSIHDSLLFYQTLGQIKLIILTVMPDHMHLIAVFNHDYGMPRLVKNFKKYQAIHLGILWQKGFFDYRIRSSKDFTEKFWYIWLNPVRAGFVDNQDDWPYTAYGNNCR